jgi:hypothetical protein
MIQKELQDQLLSAPANTTVILRHGVKCVAECAMPGAFRCVKSIFWAARLECFRAGLV